MRAAGPPANALRERHIADLDTLLTALHVELTDRIIPSLRIGRSGPGKPPEVTDAELVCLAGISDHSFPRTTGTSQAAVDRIFE